MLLPIQTTPNTTHYGTLHLMSVEPIASMVYHHAYYCNLEDSNRIIGCASIFSAEQQKNWPYGSYTSDLHSVTVY